MGGVHPHVHIHTGCTHRGVSWPGCTHTCTSTPNARTHARTHGEKSGCNSGRRRPRRGSGQGTLREETEKAPATCAARESGDRRSSWKRHWPRKAAEPKRNRAEAHSRPSQTGGTNRSPAWHRSNWRTKTLPADWVRGLTGWTGRKGGWVYLVPFGRWRRGHPAGPQRQSGAACTSRGDNRSHSHHYRKFLY